MLGFGKANSIAEHQADGEVERVYYEISQSLRIRGVNLIFRKYATLDGFLPTAWDILRPTLETAAFEHSANSVRAEADRFAVDLGPLNARQAVELGESQAWHIERTLQLYRYANPKLIVIAAMVRRLLEGDAAATSSSPGSLTPRIDRGPPSNMLAMEMVEEEPDESRIEAIFQDMKSSLSLESVNSDYRSLALWPDYLAAVWERLKPLVGKPQYQAAVDALSAAASEGAASLPLAAELSEEQREALAKEQKRALEMTDGFQRLLPGLILNVALISLDWLEPAALGTSPYPAKTAGGAR